DGLTTSNEVLKCETTGLKFCIRLCARDHLSLHGWRLFRKPLFARAEAPDRPFGGGMVWRPRASPVDMLIHRRVNRIPGAMRSDTGETGPARKRRNADLVLEPHCGILVRQ